MIGNNRLPAYIAIIADGNGCRAKKRSLPGNSNTERKIWGNLIVEGKDHKLYCGVNAAFGCRMDGSDCTGHCSICGGAGSSV